MPEFRIGSIASGMGVHLHGLKQIGGVPVWAIECDKAIASVYAKNHPESQIIVETVQSVVPSELEDIDLLIATPSCKNASSCKGAARGESPDDLFVAEAIASFIKSKMPRWFMLENVWGYRNFQSFKQITNELESCGYKHKFFHLDCADFGIGQSRKRLYLLASKDGGVPGITPPNTPKKGWHESIIDLIPTLPRTKATAAQRDLLQTNPLPLQPSPTFLIRRVGRRKGEDRVWLPHEPVFTIRALGRNCSNHWQQADIHINGELYAVTPQACLRFFGDKETADKIWLPPARSLAMEVVGNGASWVMFRELFEKMLKVGETVEILNQDYLKPAQTLVVGNDQSLVPSDRPTDTPKPKSSDCWYTPDRELDLVAQVLGEIDLDPCADDGKHVKAAQHFTFADDGLSQEWYGRVFMNPPYSCPGTWLAKLQAEYDSGRVTEAIALVPASTDTNWLSPLLANQPICFWKGRIKFLDADYEPKQSGRQALCFLYWGANSQKFNEVFKEHGIVKNINLGRVFQGTARPATKEDIAILAPGDWVKLREMNFCYQFKKWEDDDLAIGEFEGKKFEMPKHSLMVVSILDGQPIEKFRKPEVSTSAPVPTTDSSTNTNQPKIMFEFPQTQDICQQIAQMQEQLKQLTASLQPYKELEDKANDLLIQVAAHAQLMREQGVEERSLVNWASQIYSAVGVESIQIDGEAIEVLRKENLALTAKVAELEKLTDDMDTQLAEQKQQIPEVEALQHELSEVRQYNQVLVGKLRELSNNPVHEKKAVFNRGDRIEYEGEAGAVTHVPKTFTGILSIKVGDKEFNCHQDNLKHILVDDRGNNLGTLIPKSDETLGVNEVEAESTDLADATKNEALSDIDARFQGVGFIEDIRNYSKSKIKEICWADVENACSKDVRVLRGMHLGAKVKVQKDFISALPRLLSEYIGEFHDNSPLEWVGEELKSQALEMLNQAAA